MKSFVLGAAMICGMLTGCAPGPHLDVTDTIWNVGFTDPGKELYGRNMIAPVGYDETFIGNYPLGTRSVMWVHGFQEGTSEYQLRAVHLNVRWVKTVLWETAGSGTYSMAAAVPDHIERLHAGDIVEFRAVGYRHTSDNFLTTGQGNIVLRVLCHVKDADYKKCRAALPRPGDQEWPGGSLGTPYPPKASDYGWRFTPAYDASGKPLRSIPEYRSPQS